MCEKEADRDRAGGGRVSGEGYQGKGRMRDGECRIGKGFCGGGEVDREWGGDWGAASDTSKAVGGGDRGERGGIGLALHGSGLRQELLARRRRRRCVLFRLLLLRRLGLRRLF
jgi:hypothetical protein